MSIHKEYGITVLRQELSIEQTQKLSAEVIPQDLEARQPDYNDQTGNEGYILWQRKVRPAIPPYLISALKYITNIPNRTSNLRSAQLNIQQPYGEQAFHTDEPFSTSLTIHLSPDGLFEFQDNDGKIHGIPVSIGDVVVQGMAKTLLHRGRNPSDKTRYTLSMFFNRTI